MGIGLSLALSSSAFSMSAAWGQNKAQPVRAAFGETSKGFLLGRGEQNNEGTVSSPDFEETKSVSLARGQQFDIIVYLASLGDPVEQYLVILRRESDNKRLQTLLSDEHGRVRFKKLDAGGYRVSVSRRVKEDGELSTVTVGDVVLVKRKRQLHIGR